MKRKYLHPALKFKGLLMLTLFTSIISLFIISCSKLADDFNFNKIAVPEWNPEFAIPLVNSTFALNDFFGNSGNLFIKVNPDNSLSFVYSSNEMYSKRAEDFIQIPDQAFDFQSPFIVPPLPPGSSYEISLVFPVHILAGSPDQRLDSLLLKGGVIQVAGQSSLNKDVTELSIKIPEIVNITTGEPLVLAASLNNPGGLQTSVSYDLSASISDYKFIFNNTASSKNQLTFQCSLLIQGDNNPDQSPYNFSISGGFNDLNFKVLYGYLGSFNVSLSDSLPISLFNRTIGGGIDVGPGSIDLFINVNNSIGMPVTIGVEHFYAYSKVNNPGIVDIYFNGAGVPNIFTIDSPDFTQVGESVETHFDFENNNFSEAFNIAPDKLYYKFVGITNSMGDTLIENFVMDTSRISMDLAVEVQLFAAISKFIIEDTIDFKMSDVNKIDNLLFRVNTTNGFPLNADLQLYFTDNSFHVLDSLITDPDQTIIQGAPVNGAPEYRVTEPVHKKTDVNFTGSRIHNILDAKKLILRAGLSTTDQQLVKIYNNYSLQIQIGTIAGINIINN
jgi:hypothetical protein